MMNARVWSSSLIVVLLVAACSSGSKHAGTKATTTTTKSSLNPNALAIVSGAFLDGGAIPKANTCDGAGTEPLVAWHNVPTNAKSVALVVDDPDAPGGTFVHTVVVDLPPSGSLPPLPSGAMAIKAWTPPCPPPGKIHHYRFTIYALSRAVTSQNEIAGVTIAHARVVGTYQR